MKKGRSSEEKKGGGEESTQEKEESERDTTYNEEGNIQYRYFVSDSLAVETAETDAPLETIHRTILQRFAGQVHHWAKEYHP